MSDTSNPFYRKEAEEAIITELGAEELARVTTNPTGQVYALTNVSPVVGAACMARLSRRAGDLRECYLDEFATTGADGADALIDRVVTQYGDDSVQQLIGLQFVVEEASNLLTKLLEWGRLGSYLEQSTRYIYFDKKNKDGRYRYYTPALFPSMRRVYRESMDGIFDRYSSMVHELTEYLRKQHPEPKEKKERIAWLNSTRATACDAIRPTLPVATQSTVGLYMSTQAIESLVVHLLSEPLEEAHKVGQMILDECRKVTPAFLRRADLPERGGASTAYRAATRRGVAELSRSLLKDRHEAWKGEEVALIDYWPKDELELAAEMLFESSSLSVNEIKRQLSKLGDDKKKEIINAYMGERLNRRHRPGRAAEKAHFEWEIVSDYGTFRDLQRHRIVDSFEWQKLTPQHGYEVPQLVIDAGLEKPFRECFEISKRLYGALAEEEGRVVAQYAVLLGHKMRYRYLTNLRESFHLLELRTGPDGHPGYRRICHRMYELLAEVYPIAGEAMRFIGKREDPELTRQAAELATQYKLEVLEAKEKGKSA